MAFQVLLAGQDITLHVLESSIDISDVLGQGAGTGSITAGRAAECAFITDLGPISSAKGAGQNLAGGPWLVRQGELIITDALGNRIFGGYATDYIDATVKKKVYTQVKAHDYWQQLDRIIINEVYDGQTDIFIIKDLLTKYASWVDTSLLPTTSSYTFGPKNFTHFTLQKAIQAIVDATGYAIWIDYYKKVHYTLPTNASTAPFSLSSSPDFRNSFQFGLVSHERDDTAAINRVYFYGGKNLSNDYTQDLSIQANGVSTTFTLAYYPHKSADGHFHIFKNGTEYSDSNGLLGFVGGNGAKNTLIKDGGQCQVLMNIDSHTLEWNSAPAAGATISAKYRHEVPLVVVITDENSHQFYGTYLDGVISDSSVFDSTTAVQRCRVVLLEQSLGVETLQVRCWKAGLQSGQLLRIDESVRNIHNTYIIQKVEVKPQGGGDGGAGHFEYTVDLGAWRWDVVDILMQSARAATPTDDSADANTTPLAVQQALESHHVADAVTKILYTTKNFTYDTGAQVGHYGLSTYA